MYTPPFNQQSSMGPAAIAAGVQGVAQIAGGLFGQKRQYKYQKRLADHTFNRQLEMWNLQNAYNDPSAQMQRLKDAGLNPRLIYGQSSGGASGQASQMPQYQMPKADMSYHPLQSLAPMIGMYQDFKTRQAQIDILEERARQEDIKTISDKLDLGVKEHIDWTRRTVPFTEAQLLRRKNIAQEYQNRVFEQKAGFSDELSKYNAPMAKMAYQRQTYENIVKHLEAQYAEDGVRPQDSIQIRMLAKFLAQSGLGDLFQSGVRYLGGKIRKRK